MFQVNVCLECISTSLRTLKRGFIRCSAQATITHLKKFIAKKILNGMEKYREVSIVSQLFILFNTYITITIHTFYFLIKGLAYDEILCSNIARQL